MKVFFLKDHSLYKIFKTLEKLPSGKIIHISIDPEHAFFDNEWRWKQIKELIVQKNINAFFITKTEKAKIFFEKVDLPVIHHEQHKVLKVLHLGYLFLFNIKKFHIQSYAKKNYMFYLVFSIEVVFALLILYLLYSLIIPRTIVDIYPSNQTENIIYNFRYYPANDKKFLLETKNLAIPYQAWFIDYKYTLSISVKNIKHIQSPSQWTIKIINPTEKKYELIKGTRFISNDGLIFRAKGYFELEPNAEKTIQVVAAEQDDQGNVIGARGNIPQNTTLYIRNLKDSYFLKNIYAVSTVDFSWWSLTSEGIVTQRDIDALSGKLIASIKEQKQNIINQNFTLPWQIFLHFDDLIDVEVLSVNIESKIQDKVPYLKGSVVARFSFAYINQEDLFQQTKIYIQQRPSDEVELLTIDKSSIVFFSNIKKLGSGAYIIPTKLSIIQRYDFQKDINNVIGSIKTSILGVEKQQAKSLLLGYPEISSANISVRPPRYTSVTKLKSRIKINIVQKK
jgi:hypothetical protein